MYINFPRGRCLVWKNKRGTGPVEVWTDEQVDSYIKYLEGLL